MRSISRKGEAVLDLLVGRVGVLDDSNHHRTVGALDKCLIPRGNGSDFFASQWICIR